MFKAKNNKVKRKCNASGTSPVMKSKVAEKHALALAYGVKLFSKIHHAADAKGNNTFRHQRTTDGASRVRERETESERDGERRGMNEERGSYGERGMEKWGEG